MISEQEEELLESYLDDALSPDEVEQVATRLNSEPAFASALDALRAQRRARSAVWSSIEPTGAQASALAESIIRSARRQRNAARFGWALRAVSAAAACMLMGLGGGYLLWGHPASPGIVSPANSIPTIAQILPHSVNVPNPDVQPVSSTLNLPAGPYQVELTDQGGNVLAVQKFNKLEEAQHFAEDLGQVVERQQDVQNGHVTLISDHF